ncbi:MAG: EF-hand domain-containing protein [Gammaproteobacteria bacterium]|nr:EF-hand domain-containing protein [Gammaproteobacteria bacterium]MDH5802959.1 EF-hand domain-containing protein [Gammaproteobacteria bacterium]
MRYASVICFLSLLCISCQSNAPKEQDKFAPTRSSFDTIWNALATHDSNADGYIDSHEFNRFSKDPEVLAKVPENQQLIFEDIDENGDGLISQSELTTLSHRQMW